MAIKQIELDQDDILDKEFSKSTKMSKENRRIREQRKQDFTKYLRLVHIAGLVLVTILLIEQDFMYAKGLGVIVAITTLERIWNLTFRGR